MFGRKLVAHRYQSVYRNDFFYQFALEKIARSISTAMSEETIVAKLSEGLKIHLK